MSQSGRLAIESTVGQPKVFFARPDVVRASAQRLEDVESRITLGTTTTRTVTVPQDPVDPGPASHTLVQVRPEPNRAVNPDGALMDVHECDSVSEEIVKGKNVVVGNPEEGFASAGSVSARWGDINDIARAATGFDQGDAISDFAAKRRQAKDERPNVRDPALPVRDHVRDYFAHGWFRRSHLIPDVQVLRALGIPGVPQEALAQVYELHVGKTEEQRPDRYSLLSYVEGLLKFQRVRQYQLYRDDENLNQRLGINEEAAPEVGESFSTLAQWSPQAVDEHGVLSHEVDLSQTGFFAAESVLNDLLRLQSSAQLLGTLAADQYRRARHVVPFQEHHAAVVARDGPDAVTFENYNRAAEQSALGSDLWDDLLEEFPRFDRNIKAEVREVRDGLDQVRRNPDLDPLSKALQASRLKQRHLELLREKFLSVAEYTGLNVDSNLGEDSTERWFFAMYGPGAQSFHATWSGAVANAVTVRTSGEVEDFKRRRIAELRGRVAGVAYRTAIDEDLANGRMLYEALSLSLLGPLEEAGTRPQVADAYRNLADRLDDLEGDLGPTDEDDALVVEGLLAGDRTALGTSLVRLRQRRSQAVGRWSFHRNQAIALSPRHPELVRKYAGWAMENRRRWEGIDRKLALLQQFV